MPSIDLLEKSRKGEDIKRVLAELLILTLFAGCTTRTVMTETDDWDGYQ